jgi:hypothetical protein
MNRRVLLLMSVLAILSLSIAPSSFRRGSHAPPRPAGDATLLSYSHDEEAWVHSKGRGVTVAVMDWQFDPDSPARELYVSPTSLIPGEKIGDLSPWHGSWMVNIVHAVAPEASIIPIIGRSLKRGYSDVVPLGIRLAADHGASVVTSSMASHRRQPDAARRGWVRAREGVPLRQCAPRAGGRAWGQTAELPPGRVL